MTAPVRQLLDALDELARLIAGLERLGEGIEFFDDPGDMVGACLHCRYLATVAELDDLSDDMVARVSSWMPSWRPAR